jgi:hypothetical protein
MVIQVAVDGHTLDTLMSFDADDLEDQGNDEPHADDEEDGSPSWCELVLRKVIRRRRPSSSTLDTVSRLANPALRAAGAG